MSPDPQIGCQKAIEHLRKCSSEHGFFASLEKQANYRRIWSRDGVICGLASLFSGEQDLIQTFRLNLDTLHRFQGRQGEIASNVGIQSKRVSYGTLAGRVDAALWYVIGCGKYYGHTQDGEFLQEHFVGVDKTVRLLESWEFNRRGFIFVPEAGDWADEMPRRGYLLYDQVLYCLALGEFIKMKQALGEYAGYWQDKQDRLKQRIRVNFWPSRTDEEDEKHIYHQAIFDKLRTRCDNRFWLEVFDVSSRRFDLFANALTIIAGLSSQEQNSSVIEYISRISKRGLAPAFHPVIKKGSPDWEELEARHLFGFKNKPYSYHNGGLWPMVNGFYSLALSRAGREDLAKHYLEKITEANYLHKDKGREWGFCEYLHGRKKIPEGVCGTAWSAAGQILAFNSKQVL